MLRRSLIAALLLALLAPAQAAARKATVELMPGVTYTREVRLGKAGPIVVHSIVAPKPGGLYALEPVLSNDRVLGRETVSSMQQRLAGVATVAGVNGDLFTWETGHPTGILMRDGVLQSRPTGARSSLGIGADGLIRIDRVDFFGTWQVAGGPKSPLTQFNRPLPDEEQSAAGLFTPAWGEATPRLDAAVDVVLTGFPAAVPNADLTGQVADIRLGGGTPIPLDGAVVQAKGPLADELALQAIPGQPVTVQLILRPWWDGVPDAIGGGPVIVRDGGPIYRANEQFTPGQLRPRHPRTAVGQLADGRVILVAVDGRSEWSAGVNLWELALEMIRLGAVNAMALDAGGSTTIAFDGRVLNRPSDGSEREVGDALMVLYYGVFAPAPRYAVVSPNGDGYAETEEGLAYKIVKASTVDAKLVAPDGTVVWSDTGAREPGVYPVLLDPVQALALEGRYELSVAATDADGAQSAVTRAFAVNNTLGFLRFSKRLFRPKPKVGGPFEISFELTASAWVVVTVEDERGTIVRRLKARRYEPGDLSFVWDGKNARGKVVARGKYTVRVRAANDVGLAALERKIAVRPRPGRPGS